MTRPALILAATLLLLPVAAGATGGFECRTADRSIVLTGSYGAANTNIDAIFLTARGRTLSTADPRPRIFLTRSWFDEREIRVDLDDNDGRPVARLRTRLRQGRRFQGTLRLGAATHRVQCEFERMDL